MRYVFALFVILSAAPAAAQLTELTAEGHAVDGDTIGLSHADGGEVTYIKLWGVQVPPLEESNGHGWYAKAVIDRILEKNGPFLVCQQVAEDSKTKRIYATCKTEETGVNLALELLRAGWAVENRTLTRRLNLTDAPWQNYAKAESKARKARRGRWALEPKRK